MPKLQAVFFSGVVGIVARSLVVSTLLHTESNDCVQAASIISPELVLAATRWSFSVGFTSHTGCYEQATGLPCVFHVEILHPLQP